MKAILFIVLCFSVLNVHAGTRGMKWGVGLTTFTADINDPEGATNASRLSKAYSVISLLESGRDNRWYSVINMGSYGLESSTREIGQTDEFYYLGTTYQKNVRWTRNIKPWFGIGLGLGYESFSRRHTVDVDGFLAQTYRNREVVGGILMLDVSHNIDINKQDIVIRLGFNGSLSNGSNLTELSVFWMFD